MLLNYFKSKNSLHWKWCHGGHSGCLTVQKSKKQHKNPNLLKSRFVKNFLPAFSNKSLSTEPVLPLVPLNPCDNPCRKKYVEAFFLKSKIVISVVVSSQVNNSLKMAVVKTHLFWVWGLFAGPFAACFIKADTSVL